MAPLMNTSWSTSLLFVALLVFTLPLFAHDAHNAYEPELASLDWQTGSLWNEDKAIRVRFRAEHSPLSSALYSNKTIGNEEVSEQIHVKGSPFQRFTVCARQIEAEGTEILGSYSQANTGENSTLWIRLEETEASLTLTGSHRCSESTAAGPDTQLRLQTHYQWQNALISNAPFLVRYTKDKNTKVPKQRRKPASPFSLPISLFPGNEPASYETGGGSWDTDDHDPFTKRPPFFPMQLSGDFSITLLPILRLVSNWQQYLPGTQSLHWLLGEPDQSAGLILQLRFDDQSPVVLYISQAEFGELSEHLLNTRQLLYWLAPKLNGRAAFVQQLLELSESMAETTVWPEETLQSIQQQLAIILEQPDTEFSLIFEYHDLTGRLSNSLPPGSTQLGNTLAKVIYPSTAGASDSGQTSSGRTSTGRENNQQHKPNSLYPNLDQANEEGGGMDALTTPMPHYTVKVQQTEFRLSRPQVLTHLFNLFSQTHLKLECKDCSLGGIAPTDMLAHAEGHCLACAQCQGFVPGVGTLEARRRMLQSHTGSQCQNYQGEVLTPPLMDDGLTTLHFMFRFGTEETLLDLLQVFDLPITESHLQQRDRYGRTLLHDLALHPSAPVINAFFQRFKSTIKPEYLQIQDSNTWTPLHYMLNHFSQDQLQIFWKQCSDWLKPERLAMSTERLSTPINLLEQRQNLPEDIVQPFIDRATLQLPENINEQDREGETILHRVARKGDTTTVKDLIQWGAQVDEGTSDGYTPLHIAVENGHPTTTEKLIQLGAQVDKTRKYGVTPLHIAAREGLTAIAERLIEHGAQVNKANLSGFTPLYIAAEEGHTATAEMLIEHGALVNKGRDGGFTPLYTAAREGHTATAEMLIERGALVNKANKYGATPLYIAAQEGYTATAKMLIERGAQVDKADKYGATPLYIAAQEGYTATAEMLIERGAQVDKANKYGATPLYIAVKNGHTAIAERLIQLGAQVDKARQGDFIPLYIAAQNGRTAIAERLIQLGAQVDKTHSSGATPLYIAAKNGHTATAEMLIERGAQVDKANKYGATPLYIAARNGHTATVEKLIQLNAQVDKAMDGGFTPLYIAAAYGHTATAERLIQLGAQVDKATDSGFTPLLIAVENGHTGTAERLIQLGAQVDKADILGTTPLMTLCSTFKEFGLKTFHNRHKRKLTQHNLTQKANNRRSAIETLSNRNDISPATLQLFMDIVVPPEPARSDTQQNPVDQQCHYCCDKDENTVFECGHQSCDDCAKKLDLCPMCQSPISEETNKYN